MMGLSEIKSKIASAYSDACGTWAVTCRKINGFFSNLGTSFTATFRSFPDRTSEKKEQDQDKEKIVSTTLVPNEDQTKFNLFPGK